MSARSPAFHEGGPQGHASGRVGAGRRSSPTRTAGPGAHLAATRLTCDATAFFLTSRVEAFEDGAKAFEKTWRHTVPRGDARI